jgi:exo-beta-1,3-glucanase (GH17 family)
MKKTALIKIKPALKSLLTIFFLITLLMGCSDSNAVQHDNLSFVAPGIAYNPRGFYFKDDLPVSSEDQIVEDLKLLRSIGFRSLVTYGAQGVLGEIPKLARNLGFDGTMIMGIWDPFSKEEWNNALEQVSFVDGYCLGNEGLGLRYQPDELAGKMTQLRRLTGHPVTTTEPIDRYLHGPYRNWLLTHSDWLFPLAQPFLAARSDPVEAVNWIIARYDYLAAVSGSRVILKEIGFPSAGAPGGSEDAQIQFFDKLESSGLLFFHFEAFDQPWKRDVVGLPEIESHWGFYRADGTPKRIIPWLANRRDAP